MYKTLSFGEILWDHFPDYKKPGGSPANLAYHLHLFGNTSYLLSRVGSDQNGKELLQFLSEKGLSSELIQMDQKLPTGAVTVQFDDQNEPSYTIHEPSAWDHIRITPEIRELAGSLDSFCFASLSQRSPGSKKSVEILLKSVPDGCLKVFDLNLRPPFIERDVILSNIEHSDVIKLNEDEYSVVGEWLNAPDPADKIIEKDERKTVLLTLGSKGSMLVNSEGRYRQKAFPVYENGDFVGVGDAFLACFTHLMLKKTEPKQLLETANLYAAYVASQKGSMPEIPKELLDLIV